MDDAGKLEEAKWLRLKNSLGLPLLAHLLGCAESSLDNGSPLDGSEDRAHFLNEIVFAITIAQFGTEGVKEWFETPLPGRNETPLQLLTANWRSDSAPAELVKEAAAALRNFTP